MSLDILGADLQKCLGPLVNFVTTSLQPGFLASCPYFGGKVFVTGGLGALLADMPQANASASCKGPGAKKPCRFCNVDKASITEIPADWQTVWSTKTKQAVTMAMDKMKDMSTTQRCQAETAAGILYQPDNPLYHADLHFDPITQVWSCWFTLLVCSTSYQKPTISI